VSADVDLRTVENLGLALGGGGVLGAAHVGVLQVLRERDIRPTIVAGTSAGALAGAAYASGLNPYNLEIQTLQADWGTFGDVPRTPGLGLLETSGLRRTIDAIGGDIPIEDLPVRYCAVATDARTGAAVVLDQGSLADALCASIAVPGIFRPARVRGRVLVDGGLVENLPIEAAFGLGADHVIAVRLAPEQDMIPTRYTSAHVHEFEIRSDVTLIRPKVGKRSPWIRREIDELIELGRTAAERALREYPVVRERPDA
jgi:NTE family protein